MQPGRPQTPAGHFLFVEDWMKRHPALFVLLAQVWLLTALAVAAPSAGNGRTERLLELLRAKGVLSEAEVAELSSGNGDLETRLVTLLERKGVLTSAESAALLGDADARLTPVATGASADVASHLSAAQATPRGKQQVERPKEDPLARPPDFGPGEVGVSARAAIPRPVEALPLLQPFPTGALTLRLGSAATVSPYGMIKASVIHAGTASPAT